MALKRVAERALNQMMRVPNNGARLSSTLAYDHNDPKIRIGNREVVGFGYNGGLNYADRVDFPMPAVRFMEPNNAIIALNEKEKGDWGKLTIEEKKALYRASFCSTFAEMDAPDGLWKVYVGACLFSAGLAMWMMMGMKKFVSPQLPDSFSPENQEKQLQRMIELNVNPIEGIASKYDYEKGRWK